MKAAVLCPGPSLPLFAEAGSFDVVFGVNRAAGAFACNYFVALDARSFIVANIIGAPVIVSSQAELDKMKPHGLDDHKTLVIEPGWLSVNRLKWATKGLTVALVLAAQLDAREIHCFGVDWAGRKDWDGYSDDQQRRDADRWGAETELFDNTAAALTQRGIVISRHTLEGQEAKE